MTDIKLKTFDEIYQAAMEYALHHNSITDIKPGAIIKTILQSSTRCASRHDIESWIDLNFSDDEILVARPVGVSEEMMRNEIVWARTRKILAKLDLT